MTQEQERELLTQLQTKSVKAFKTLVVEYTDDLYMVTAYEIKDTERAYDLCSDFLIALFNDAFDGISAPLKVSLMKKLSEFLSVEILIPV